VEKKCKRNVNHELLRKKLVEMTHALAGLEKNINIVMENKNVKTLGFS
jgi:hypothetical protein